MSLTENGTYRARALSATLAEPKEGGSANIPVVISFECTDEHVKGQRIDAYLYFTDKTLDRSIGVLRMLGWTGDDMSNISFPDKNEADLVCELETYKGETRMKVKWVNEPGVSSVKKLALDAAMAFAARMRGNLLAVDAKLGGPPKERAPF